MSNMHTQHTLAQDDKTKPLWRTKKRTRKLTTKTKTIQNGPQISSGAALMRQLESQVSQRTLPSSMVERGDNKQLGVAYY